jgi:hypothetical protein
MSESNFNQNAIGSTYTIQTANKPKTRRRRGGRGNKKMQRARRKKRDRLKREHAKKQSTS